MFTATLIAAIVLPAFVLGLASRMAPEPRKACRRVRVTRNR